MKAENLRVLKENGLKVPEFIVTDDPSDRRLSELHDGRYAVRSSSELEDSDSKSYAGQFLTELNVDKINLSVSIKKVLKSGKKYGGKMKVIVQEMVDSDYSGVLFTANPMGILNETVIVVGKGLGENIVEDRTETTAYYYNLDDDLYYYEQQADAVLISNEIIQKLIENGKMIRDIFKKDMDIEFSVKDGIVYILQARPITTLKYDRKIILDNSNIVESYPGISLPLTQSFVKEIYRDIFRALVQRITGNERLVKKMEPVFRDMVMEANGRIYYNITNWYNVLNLLPFSGKIIPVWQEMLGVNNKDIALDFRAGIFEKSCMLLTLVHYLRVTPKEMEKLNNRFTELYPEYIRRIKTAKSISQLLSVYADIEEELIPLWDITLINDMYAFLHTYMAKKRHPKEISNIQDLESMRPVRALNDLIGIAKEHGFDSREYREKREHYIYKFGDRCLEELKLETKTYRTDPELLDEYIKSRLNGYAEQAFRGKETHDKSFFVRRAKIGIANRERSRMNRTRIFGIVRYISLEIGKRLAENGMISDERDVFYLTIDELWSLRDGGCGLFSTEKKIQEMIAERKERYTAFSDIPSYSRLVYADRIVDKAICKIRTEICGDNSVLTGIPSSPGKVTGEVLVIDKADHTIDTRDKILVTKMTDPGWVFLIRQSVGIIAEKGSMLSHTAIITRELKKPSVVNVKDVTKILKTGDRVELDADRGTVTIL